MSFKAYVRPETCDTQLKEALDNLLDNVKSWLVESTFPKTDTELALHEPVIYNCILSVYTLWKAGYDVSEYLEHLKTPLEEYPLFYHEYDYSHLLPFFSEMGVIESKYLNEIIDYFLSMQLRDGQFPNATEELLFALLTFLGTEHPQIQLGVKYILAHIQDYLNFLRDFEISNPLEPLCWSIMILLRYADRYQTKVYNLNNELAKLFSNHNLRFQKGVKWWLVNLTLAMSGQLSSEVGKKLKKFLLENLFDKETGKANIHVVLALLYTDLGPKIPLIYAEVLESTIRTKSEANHPVFLHTSPIYGEDVLVREIYEKIVEMFDRAERSVKICTPYPDILYEKLVDLATIKKLDVKVISRPKDDMSRVPDVARRRIAKSVIDILSKATQGHQTNHLVHARLIIIDNQEVLVSSADLNHDSLISQYNAGIYTRDSKTVQNACAFFDNLWNECVRSSRAERKGSKSQE